MTSVWPALWPPWKRTTMSACSESQSTILPLPSSPHWAPTTTTLAMPACLPATETGTAPPTGAGNVRREPFPRSEQRNQARGRMFGPHGGRPEPVTTGLLGLGTGVATGQFVRLDHRHGAGLIGLHHSAGRAGIRRLDHAVVLLELVAERLVLRRRVRVRANALGRRRGRTGRLGAGGYCRDGRRQGRREGGEQGLVRHEGLPGSRHEFGEEQSETGSVPVRDRVRRPVLWTGSG